MNESCLLLHDYKLGTTSAHLVIQFLQLLSGMSKKNNLGSELSLMCEVTVALVQTHVKQSTQTLEQHIFANVQRMDTVKIHFNI